MKVIIRNEQGQYLAMKVGKVVFTDDRKRAFIYDTETDDVEGQLRQVKQQFGAIWTAEPLEPAAIKPAGTLTDAERVRCHMTFLASNWALIASFAWAQYQTNGRGAVVVPEEDIVTPGVQKLAAIRFAYVAGREELLTLLKAQLGEKEDRWLAEYDPDAKVILVVVGDRGASSYLAGGLPKPSVCCARQQAQGN